MKPDSEPIEIQAEEAGVPAIRSRPRPPKKNRSAWVVAALVLIAFAAIGISPRLSQKKKLDEQVAAVKQEVPLVSVVSLKMTPGASEIFLPSSLQAVATTTINARTDGYVKARYVDIGSRVTAGQVLAEIESPEVDQQVMQSQAEVARSVAGVGQAQADVSRLRAAYSEAQSGLVQAKANLDQTKSDLNHLKAKALEASSSVDVARARLTQAQKRLESVRALLQSALVAEDIAKKTLVRWKQLEAANAVSGQDVDEKQSDYDSSRAKVDASRADVSSAEADALAAKEIISSQQAELVAAQSDIRSGQQRIAASQASVNSAASNVTAAQAAILASQSSVEASRATVGSNEANVRRYSAMQTFEKVLAPFSGVITARNVDVGDLVGATTSGSGAIDQTSTVTKSGLFGLSKTDVLLAQANVPEDSVSSIREGQLADVAVSEYPGRTFAGTVKYVSGALDATSRTLLVEVQIPNGSGALKPGMYAQIHFMGAKSRSVLRIPATGLIFGTKGNRVLVVTPEGTLHYVPVTVGRDFGSEIEILRGLNGTEQLVTNADESLQEGEKVRIAPAQK